MGTVRSIAAIIAFGLCLLAIGPGCTFQHAAGSAAHQLTAAQAKVEAAQIRNQATIDDARGKANPILHPIDASNGSVKHITRSLEVINIVSVLALIAGIGLLFSPFSFASKILAPLGGAGVVISLTGIVTIPFAPMIIWSMVGVGAMFGIYELARNRKTILSKIEGGHFLEPIAAELEATASATITGKIETMIGVPPAASPAAPVPAGR